jgi:hypothetical protein
MRVTTEQLERVGPGIQLAVFETVWPAFVNLGRVFCDVTSDGQLSVLLEWSATPTDQDQVDVERLMTEIAEVAFGPATEVCFTSTTGTSAGSGRLLMSPSIFAEIASKHAPHRLKAGR